MPQTKCMTFSKTVWKGVLFTLHIMLFVQLAALVNSKTCFNAKTIFRHFIDKNPSELIPNLQPFQHHMRFKDQIFDTSTWHPLFICKYQIENIPYSNKMEYWSTTLVGSFKSTRLSYLWLFEKKKHTDTYILFIEYTLPGKFVQWRSTVNVDVNSHTTAMTKHWPPVHDGQPQWTTRLDNPKNGLHLKRIIQMTTI